MKPVSLIECFRQDIINAEAIRRRLGSAVSQAGVLNIGSTSPLPSVTARTQKVNQDPPSPYPNNLNRPLQLTMAMSNSHIETKPTSDKLKHLFRNTPFIGALLNWTYKIIALPSRFYKLQRDFSNRAAWVDHYGNHLIQTSQNHSHQVHTFDRKMTEVLIELQTLSERSLTQASKIESLESELAVRANECRVLKTQLQRQFSDNEQLKKHLNIIAQDNRLPINEINKTILTLEEATRAMSLKIAEIELISISRLESAPDALALTDISEQVAQSSRLLNQAIEKTNSLEKEFTEKLAEILATDSQLEGALAALQVNLQNAAHTIHHASNLAYDTAHKVHIESEEIRIRLLRLERKLKHYTQPAAFLENNNITSASIGNLSDSHEIDKAIANTAENIIEADFDYFMFTHKFRGSIEEIKRRQSVYLEYFEGKQNVVDLGCGRGEFLSLLSENGITACGIDLSEDNIDYCIEFGLNARRYNIFDFLTSIPDESLDGIFSAQVIEHLTPTQIIQLVNLCNLKLKRNGVLILESVNTNCIQALIDFYIDPTHVRPVPPDFMQFLLQSKMFKVKPIKFSTPISPDLAPIQDSDSGTLITNYVDYAVIGHKA